MKLTHLITNIDYSETGNLPRSNYYVRKSIFSAMRKKEKKRILLRKRKKGNVLKIIIIIVSFFFFVLGGRQLEVKTSRLQVK